MRVTFKSGDGIKQIVLPDVGGPPLSRGRPGQTRRGDPPPVRGEFLCLTALS